MIEVLRANFYYKIETKLDDSYNEKIADFLYKNGVKEKELGQLNIKISDNVGEILQFKAKNFNLQMKIHENKIVFLFETQLDTSEWYDLIAGHFN